MGGININQKHNLINKSKSPLFYTLISVIILAILTIIAISIKLSFSNAAGEAEGANDTGVATLNKVDILQAGTGQSVTIKGETLNENDYGTDNATRRTILNNNVVRYSANYNVTKTGQITFSITLPANNTIDEATIAESQYCIPNLSKLEPADITNSDGTITKSYTNNKATCVRNITNTGSTSWQITAYLWGANNTQIQPTLAVSGETSTVRPEEISVVGRGDYGVRMSTAYSQVVKNGWDYTVYPIFTIYANKTNDDMLGVAPLEGGWSIELDTSNLPDGWEIERCNNSDTLVGVSGGTDTSVVYSGEVSCARSSSGDNLTLSWSGGVTGARHCPVRTTVSGTALSNTTCWYGGASVLIKSPTISLTPEVGSYSMKVMRADASIAGVGNANISVDGLSYSWSMSNKAYGNPIIWGAYNQGNVGWINFLNSTGTPVYIGQKLTLGNWIQLNTVPASENNIATNLNYCTSWNPSEMRLTSEFGKSNDLILSDYKVQYGIIGTDMSVLPSSSQQYCGKVGDENIPGQHMFFDTLEEANQYAKDNNLAVNAMRLWSAETKTGVRDGYLGSFHVTRISKSEKKVKFNVSGTTDEWSYRSQADDATSSDTPLATSYNVTPGLLSHTLTAIPSSTNPGKEDHITITTKTYNKDTNSKITINLPNGLTPKEGSFTITTGYTHNKVTNTNEPIKAVLIEGENQDYTITANGGSSSEGSGSSSNAGNVSYTITLDLDHIASTHHVPITGYDPIYPGESGVTNITLNSDTGLYEEVITTNNNNEDSDITNDDLPIAADNNGNGISHIDTPIEFDVTVNEDTPSPSTLTINSTASGTGTDYASTTFKTASDTIAVAEPPAMFGYDLVASSDNIYAGDDLTYNYSISNTTSNPTSDITMITVLPFNGDSRGTTGLKNLDENTTQASSSSASNPASGSTNDSTNNPVSNSSSTTSNPYAITNPYTITNLSLSLPSDGASGLDTSATKLYYTLDPKAHELESNPEALALDSSITWQELELDSDGNIPGSIMTNLQDQGILDSITALKLTTTTLPSSSSLKLNVTLDNILANTTSNNSLNSNTPTSNTSTGNTPTTTIASDITYLAYASEANQAVEQTNTKTTDQDATDNTTTTNNTATSIKTILRREGNITTYSNGQIVSVHQNPVTVTYLGELLALSIPEHEQAIQVTLGLNDVVIGNPDIRGNSTNPVNHLNLVTATLRGYNLTIQTDTENGALIVESNTDNNTLRSIPAISAKPTKGTAGWSAKIAGSNNPDLATTTTTTTTEDTWTAIPGTNQTPLNLYTSTAKGRDNINLTITYGISVAGTIADTYSTKVVYTVVAEP